MIAGDGPKGFSIRPPLFPAQERKMKIELDKKALFALASDSRIEILKALQPTRRTITQLADELQIDKAGVHRHLKKLEEGGLVIRNEDHGFVYYGLSWKARDIVSPGENTKIVIIFSSSWLLILASIVALVLGLASAAYNGARSVSQGQMAGSGGTGGGAASLSPEIVIGVCILVACALALAYLGYRRLRRPKQRSATEQGVDDAGLSA